MQYDVFNGDADGICALQQLRLQTPDSAAELVTGVKRDINLLRKIEDVESCSVTVLDVSLDRNRQSLQKMLQNNNQVLYIDHHFAGEIPESGLLEYHIEPSAKICTSLIVNKLLHDKYVKWAICGAFGDNLHETANQHASAAGLSSDQIDKLQEIGELFNYNGYGANLEDLHIAPADLFLAIKDFVDPLEFYSSTDLVSLLRNGYKNDMARVIDQKDISDIGPNRVYRFPATSWARRMAGVFSNLKAREKKDAAHVVIVENDDNTLQISVRAPFLLRKNADTLCRQFPTGGGRAAAAGINKLPPDMLNDFLQAFYHMYR